VILFLQPSFLFDCDAKRKDGGKEKHAISQQCQQALLRLPDISINSTYVFVLTDKNLLARLRTTARACKMSDLYAVSNKCYAKELQRRICLSG